jgi:hypothetical protein
MAEMLAITRRKFPLMLAMARETRWAIGGGGGVGETCFFRHELRPASIQHAMSTV